MSKTGKDEVEEIDPHAFVEFMKLLVVQGGAVALELRPHVRNIGKHTKTPRGSEKDTRAKAAREAKTAVDVAVQELVLAGLLRRFPQIKIALTEEDTRSSRSFQDDTKKRYRFVIDPLDGTLPYIEGSDGFGILTGLVDRDSFAAAVLYYPGSDQLYWAVEHAGAYREQRGLTQRLDLAACRAKSPVVEINSRVIQQARDALHNVGFEVDLVDDAATAILRVAEGKVLAYCCHSRNLHDIAMAAFIAQEAGATVCSWDSTEILYPYTEPVRIPRLLVTASREEQITAALRPFST